MYARVQHFHRPAAELDQLTGLVEELFAKSPPRNGFRGFEFLVDRAAGKAMLVSFWDTEEDLRELEATNAPAQEQVQASAGFTPPPAEVFEVALRAPAS